MRRVTSVTVLAIIILPGLGGCPVVPEAFDAPPTARAPGSYWVDAPDGALAYYELPKQRGAAGRWIALEEDDIAWFSGPAFYTFDDERGWSRDPTAEGFTLDEAIQLHDPAPAPIP